MTFPTHLFAGLAVGAFTGDYTVAVVASVAPDIDHVVSYARHGVFKNAETFWSVITAEADPWNDQRNVLHNILVPSTLSILAYIFFPEHALALVLGYGIHLTLDAFDASDFYPFYPWKRINLRGPIHYNSKWEFALAIPLLLAFLYFLMY